MHIVPVIDVRYGRAVRAVMGDRANYKPLETPLASGSSPLEIARGYLTLFPFPTIYVADLDGIERRGTNPDLAPMLAHALPATEFWIDAGASSPDTDAGHPRATAVIGSETLSPEHLDAPLPAGTILSLDFRGNDFQGHPALIDSPSLWPDRVIVMTLARVGSDTGPDVSRISDIARRAGRRRIYAAGGIRNRQDLLDARNAGASGALVATALHAQKIKAADLSEIGGL